MAAWAARCAVDDRRYVGGGELQQSRCEEKGASPATPGDRRTTSPGKVVEVDPNERSGDARG
jgi:hypothetical protein